MRYFNEVGPSMKERKKERRKEKMKNEKRKKERNMFDMILIDRFMNLMSYY